MNQGFHALREGGERVWVERRAGPNGRGSLGISMGAESKTINIQMLYMGVERNSVGREIFVVPTELPLLLLSFGLIIV